MSRPNVYLYVPRNTNPGYIYFDWDKAIAAMLEDYGYASVEDLIDDHRDEEVYVDYEPEKYLIIDDSGGQIQEIEVKG